jgi:hypothetical protein
MKRIGAGPDIAPHAPTAAYPTGKRKAIIFPVGSKIVRLEMSGSD